MCIIGESFELLMGSSRRITAFSLHLSEGLTPHDDHGHISAERYQ